MVTGDKNRLSIISRTTDVIKTLWRCHKEPPKLKNYQKAMQIVDSRSLSVKTGACLTVSKQDFDSLVLLVDSKLEAFCSYLHPTMPLQL